MLLNQQANAKRRSNGSTKSRSKKSKTVKKAANEIMQSVKSSVKKQRNNRKRNNNLRKGIKALEQMRDIPRGRTMLAPRALRTAAVSDSTLKSETKALLSAMLLPYEGALPRVRTKGQTCVSESSAVSRNHVFYNIDISSVVQEDSLCGQLFDGTRVFQNLSSQTYVINVLDARVVGITPYRKSSNLSNPCSYFCNAFMNPNQTDASNFIFRKQIAGFGSAGTDERTFGKTPDDVFWLDFCDFLPVNSSDMYGPLHPPVDGPAGRYIWIDAQLDEVIDERDITNVQITMNKQNIWFIPQKIPNDVLQSRVFFVAESLPASSDASDVVVYSSCFIPDIVPLPVAGSSFMFTALNIKHSGYYRLGICGQLVKNPDLPGNEVNSDLVLENVQIQINTDRRINIGTRHIVNPNIVSTNTPGAFNLFDRIATNFGSCLIKNVTPELFKGGQMYAIANVTDKFWYDFTKDGQTINSSSSDPNLTYSGNLSKGAYGWLRNEHFGFRPGVETGTFGSTLTSTTRSFVATRLSDRENAIIRAQNLYLIVPPPQGTNIGNVFPKFTVMFTVQFEYTTLNQIPMQSSRAIDDLEGAMAILKRTNTFTENPLHLGKFGDIIKSAGRSIADFYRDNRSAAKGLFSALSAFGGPVAGLLGKAGSVIDALVD